MSRTSSLRAACLAAALAASGAAARAQAAEEEPGIQLLVASSLAEAPGERPSAPELDVVQREAAINLCKADMAMIWQIAIRKPLSIDFPKAEVDRVKPIPGARRSADRAPYAKFAVRLEIRAPYGDGAPPFASSKSCLFEAYSASRVRMVGRSG